MRRLFNERVRPIARHLLTMMVMVLLVVQPARANVESTMNSFFAKSGAAANINGPSAYNGQSAGYYSGGSLWARYPTEQVQPFNLQMPSVRAGCGGIDLFAGSFSFINTDQIVALLKATANNAIGYAFQLAIDSISPSVGGVMKDMSQKIQQLNQFNMNSCQMAQTLVANIAPKMNEYSQRICQDLGKQQGRFADDARARHGCANQGEQASTNAGVDKDHILADRNYTWSAIQDGPSGEASLSREYSEYLMTLVGTTLYVKPKADNATDPAQKGKFTFIYPAGPTFINALLDGATAADKVDYYKCDEPTLCLKPALTPLIISKDNGFQAKVRKLISSMEGKVRLKGAKLDAAEIELLGMTSIPLYKIIVVNAASQFGAPGDMNVISEAVAIDVLVNFVEKALNDVSSRSVAMQEVEQTQAAQWAQQLQSVRENLSDRHRRKQDQLAGTFAVIQRTMMLEATLRNALSPEMSASMNFGRALTMTPGQ